MKAGINFMVPTKLAGNDYLDGGENAGEVPSGSPSWGETNRDVDDNGSLAIDRLYYIDAPSGITFTG